MNRLRNASLGLVAACLAFSAITGVMNWQRQQSAAAFITQAVASETCPPLPMRAAADKLDRIASSVENKIDLNSAVRDLRQMADCLRAGATATSLIVR